MIRFERDDDGRIVLITDDRNAELAYLDDEGLGIHVPEFHTTTLVDGEMRLVLPTDEEQVDGALDAIFAVDRLAGDKLAAMLTGND